MSIIHKTRIRALGLFAPAAVVQMWFNMTRRHNFSVQCSAFEGDGLVHVPLRGCAPDFRSLSPPGWSGMAVPG